MPPPDGKNGGLVNLGASLLNSTIWADARPSQNAYQDLLTKLGELAHWAPFHGYEYGFDIGKANYRIRQKDPKGPIEVRITNQPKTSTSTKNGNGHDHHLIYLPDGKIQSSSHPEPHFPLRADELGHHHRVETLLQQRVLSISKGKELYTLINNSLRALRARSSPETQSVWYDNFVIREGKVYSFQFRNIADFMTAPPTPELDQLSIFEDTHSAQGAKRTLLTTLSATGEANFQPHQNSREILPDSLLRQIENFVGSLQYAKAHPGEYQNRLQKILERVGGTTKIMIPKVQTSTEIPISFGSSRGKEGEPILEIRSGKELRGLFHPWATHEWKNPDVPGDIRQLSPRPRLSYHLGREMLRWTWQGIKYFLFEYVRDPKHKADYLRLRLFPEGGGEITLYREGKIYDHIIGGKRGPLWRAQADPGIRSLDWDSLSSEERLKALQEAHARRSADPAQLLGIPFKEAPPIHLDQLYQSSQGSPVEIRDTQSAWNLIQQQIPSGIEPIVHADVNIHNEMTSLEAHFHNTQPSLSLRISHTQIPVADSMVPRVEVIMQRGQDTHVRVFQDGRVRMEASQDVFYEVLRRAQAGRVQRNLLTMVGQTYLRRGAYSLANGMQFSLAHFLGLPFVISYEHLIYDPTELKMIGTPLPQFNWPYLSRHLITPFLTMAGSSGLASVMIDGIYNLRPGLRRAWLKWMSTSTTPIETLRTSNFNFFNPYPTVRPVAPNFLFRGLLQRSVPLLAGLTSLELLEHGKITPQFWKNLRDVSLVSLGSAALLRGVYSFSSLANLGMKMGLIEASGLGAGAAFSLTFVGGVTIAILEFIALGIIQAHERRADFNQLQNTLQSLPLNSGSYTASASQPHVVPFLQRLPR